MKVTTFDNKEQWMLARLGKITGTRLKDVSTKASYTKEDLMEVLDDKGIPYDKKLKKEGLEALLSQEDLNELKVNVALREKKIGYYELIAERLMVSEEEFDGYVPNETPMDRGTRLQKRAIDEFSRITGKKVEDKLVLWSRDDNESVAISPDGVVIDEPAALETKCLSAANHVKAYLTQTIPDEYEHQVFQYFIVNDELKTLYLAFYDPRLPSIAFFYLTIKREMVENNVEFYREYQKRTLEQVDEIVAKLTGF